MGLILVTASSRKEALPYLDAVTRQGGETCLLLPKQRSSAVAQLSRAHGLLLTGGADVDPSFYSQAPLPGANLELNLARDEMELLLVKSALERDMPVLGICRGMQVLNVALGGSIIQDLPDHKAELKDGRWVSARHQIWIAPGSRLTAVVGAGGYVRVNSLHHQGIREPQKSPALMASAYSPADFLIEALESPSHRWVIGVQWHPEREKELPPHFYRLFMALVQEAEEYAERRR